MSTLTRGTVKADNSCLFTAIARLCENIESEHPLKTAGRKLRGVCAEACGQFFAHHASSTASHRTEARCMGRPS